MKARLRRGILWLYRALFARPRFLAWNEFVTRLGWSGAGVMNYENARVSGEQRFLRDFARGCVAPVVVDVGANVGSWATMVRQYAPGATVYAFEPHPATFETLQRAASAAGYEAIPAGCGEARATLTLFDVPSGEASSHASFYRGAVAHLHPSATLARRDVEVIRLDDFLAERMIERVDLLKIDTEGHELAVLKGAIRSLREGRIGTIQFEFNEMNVESRVFFKDFVDLLEGFEFFRLLPFGLVALKDYRPATREVFAYQNIVAQLPGKRPYSP